MVLYSALSRVASFLLLFVFGFVVFHAPFSVFFGQFLPDILVKSWKELLLLLTLPIVIYIVVRSGSLKRLSRDRLLQLIGSYAFLHLVLLVFFQANMTQQLAGLAIDLRFFLFFALVYSVVSIFPKKRHSFIKVGALSAFFGLLFALLQAVMLPRDILAYLGYSKSTIAPYLTVDQNPDYVRINGTLRGPNPLGAYVGSVILLLIALVVKYRAKIITHTWFFAAVFIALLIILWATYSRSAVLGVIVGVAVLVLTTFQHQKLKYFVAGGVAILVIVGGILLVSKESYFVQNVLLHNNPSGGSQVNSDDNHATSLQDGVTRMIKQPFGGGVGSTGSASLYSSSPVVIENQYLFIAHESGWLGLGLFLAISGIVARDLYRRRSDWLALGLCASGVSLFAIGLMQPVFVDDTVSLVWWGASAVALARVKGGSLDAKKSH